MVYTHTHTRARLTFGVRLQVHGGTRLTFGVGGLAFIIVSAAHPPHHLHTRLESFLQNFIRTK